MRLGAPQFDFDMILEGDADEMRYCVRGVISFTPSMDCELPLDRPSKILLVQAGRSISVMFFLNAPVPCPVSVNLLF